MTDGLHISVVPSSLGLVFFSTMKYQQYINNIMAARSAATTLCTAHVYNKGENQGLVNFCGEASYDWPMTGMRTLENDVSLFWFTVVRKM